MRGLRATRYQAMKTRLPVTLLIAAATAAVLALSNPATAQKTGCYAGYGAGIGALIGLVAGDDLGDVAVGAVAGAASGGLTGAVADSRDDKARRAAAEARCRAQQEQQIADLQRWQGSTRPSSGGAGGADLEHLIGAGNYASYQALV